MRHGRLGLTVGNRIRDLDSIALGYEVEAKGERDESGVIVAREIKAKPNGDAMSAR